VAPLDQPLRNALRTAVQACRDMLTKDLTDCLEREYGIHSNGQIEPLGNIPALETDAQARETRELLERILPDPPTSRAQRAEFEVSFEAVVRSLAFTHMNRLVAFKTLEAPSRKVVRETVGQGLKSRGFIFYLADHPDDEQLWKTGRQYDAYRRFLLWQCERLNQEIGVLFDPDDLASRVFPRAKALDAVFTILNAPELASVWAHEATIGWVYQYWTPKELREQARKAHPAPRNSYEMAFRNQFYTPEYVVRFLVDNTLGRIWHEMRGGETELKERCGYLALRPDEALKLRPKKDPRTIRILDPACGSGHFLVYAFDLFQTIYREAYEDADLGPGIRSDWPSRADYEKAIPKLIIENNLFGIDIDRRAAQLAALTLFLKARSRSPEARIEMSRVVCAEPMSGERGLFEEFKQRELTKLSSGQAVVGRILDALRDHVSLAAEAGSLLRAERELERLVVREHAAWRAQRKPGTTDFLFPEMRKPTQTGFDFDDVTDEEFWHGLEATVARLFHEYAEEATGAERAHRQLFARDGVEVLRFLDTLRQRYDVVLMNPPFGDPTPGAKTLLEESYPSTAGDVYANFIERGLNLLDPIGKLGFITNRTWLGLPSFEGLRTKVLGPLGAVEVAADLGSFVLDDAQVETVTAVVGRGTSPVYVAPWIRLLKTKDKEAILLEGLASYCRGDRHRALYQSSQERFAALPSSVFGYWLSDQLVGRMKREGSVAHRGVDVRQGTATADDFRFLRLAWEVPAELVGLDRDWAPFAKGGEYSPFFDDVHLVVRWRDRGVEIAAFPKAYIRNASFYGKAGATWPRRTTSAFGPRALPPGCAFGDKGPAAIPQEQSHIDPLLLLGLLSSRPTRLLLSVRLGAGDDAPGSAAKSYEVGLIRDLPFPPLTPDQEDVLHTATRDAAQAAKAFQVQRDETTNAYVSPMFLRESGARSLRALAEAEVRRCEDLWSALAKKSSEIDAVMCEALGFSGDDRRILSEELEPPLEALSAEWDPAHDDLLARAYKTKDALPGGQLPGGLEAEFDVRVKTRRKKQTVPRSMEALCRIFRVSPTALISARRRLSLYREEDFATTAADLLSYCVGVAIGRWDVRLAQACVDLDPFAPLRCIPRGALVDDRGLPAAVVPSGYPLTVGQDGILVDTEGHENDIVGAARNVLHFLWSDTAETIEHECCALLGVQSLREYFAKPNDGGFWGRHVRRYSKSRRRAPVYWLLQSPRGFYRVWIYAHRLTKDTLPKLLGPRYLGGALTQVKHAIDELRPAGQAKGDLTKKQERRLAELAEHLLDLEEFAAQLQTVVQQVNDRGEPVGYAPNLDDGVVLNAAPLHQVIPWPRKKKHQGKSMSELAVYWDELAEGRYDWAHMAMWYWPTRVTEHCRTDRSLALAHGLEAQFFPGLREELRRQAEAARAIEPDDEPAVDETDEEDEDE
jgi:hypothetical protein